MLVETEILILRASDSKATCPKTIEELESLDRAAGRAVLDGNVSHALALLSGVVFEILEDYATDTGNDDRLTQARYNILDQALSHMRENDPLRGEMRKFARATISALTPHWASADEKKNLPLLVEMAALRWAGNLPKGESLTDSDQDALDHLVTIAATDRGDYYQAYARRIINGVSSRSEVVALGVAQHPAATTDVLECVTSNTSYAAAVEVASGRLTVLGAFESLAQSDSYFPTATRTLMDRIAGAANTFNPSEFTQVLPPYRHVNGAFLAALMDDRGFCRSIGLATLEHLTLNSSSAVYALDHVNADSFDLAVAALLGAPDPHLSVLRYLSYSENPARITLMCERYIETGKVENGISYGAWQQVNVKRLLEGDGVSEASWHRAALRATAKKYDDACIRLVNESSLLTVEDLTPWAKNKGTKFERAAAERLTNLQMEQGVTAPSATSTAAKKGNRAKPEFQEWADVYSTLTRSGSYTTLDILTVSQRAIVNSGNPRQVRATAGGVIIDLLNRDTSLIPNVNDETWNALSRLTTIQSSPSQELTLACATAESKSAQKYAQLTIRSALKI